MSDGELDPGQEVENELVGAAGEITAVLEPADGSPNDVAPPVELPIEADDAQCRPIPTVHSPSSAIVR